MTSQPAEPLPVGYEWPPLPVLDRDKAALILAERLQEAYDDLEAQRVALVAAAGAGQVDLIPAWVEEFQAEIQAFMARAAEEVAAFLALHLGPRYEEGMIAAGGSSFTQAHTTALVSLATDTYEDFLARALEAQRVSEAFVRAVRTAAAQEIPKIAAGGRTAVQVGDRLEARLLRQYGITEVTYRDGSRVPVRVYARMAARTKSAVAFNAGSLNEWYAQGVVYVEVFDGTDCGWTSHDDPDKANGSVRSVAAAAAHIIAHPNCQRGFGARPDVTTDAEAEQATATSTPEQRADQATVDYYSGRSTQRTRPAALRRARQTAQRQARLLGVTEPEQVGDIIRRVLAEQGLI